MTVERWILAMFALVLYGVQEALFPLNWCVRTMLPDHPVTHVFAFCDAAIGYSIYMVQSDSHWLWTFWQRFSVSNHNMITGAQVTGRCTSILPWNDRGADQLYVNSGKSAKD